MHRYDQGRNILPECMYLFAESWRHGSLYHDGEIPWDNFLHFSWWSPQMETFSVLLAICAGNSQVICQIWKSHGKKNFVDFDSNWAFLDCNSSLNSPMALKWCTKLEAAYQRCPIFFKVIHQISRSHWTKSLILTRIECFQTVTPFWIHWWLWNDAQSLIFYRRGALFFSRSFIKFQGHRGWKIHDLNSISVRSLGQSQLSNPSDLPCFYWNTPRLI